jgi:acetyl esterase
MPASYYLDPPNKAFNDAVSKGPGLYTKTPQEAREIVEGLQKHDPASDIAVEEIKVPAAGGEVTTVIFRPAESAHRALPVVFYTHGGGWILGRCVAQ